MASGDNKAAPAGGDNQIARIIANAAPITPPGDHRPTQAIGDADENAAIFDAAAPITSAPGHTAGDLDGELALLPLTDLGNATRFLRRYGPDFKWCPVIGWLFWDGRRWNRDGAEMRLEGAVKETIRLIDREADAIRETDLDYAVGKRRVESTSMHSDRVSAWCATSQSAAHIGCIPRLVTSDLAIDRAALDADPFKINVLNGTLTVRKTEDGDYIGFSPHNPADLITKIIPHNYDQNAEAPCYDAFLQYVQPDLATRRFLHQWGGLSLTGDTSEQCLIFNYGKGKNGKSTLMDCWSHVAGDYAQTVPIESFLDQGRPRRGADATPDIAMLPGVRMLTTSEPERGAKLAEAMIKLLTGGEEINARHLNREFFRFRPEFKLSMSGNYRPRIVGTEEGIWRRVKLVPWTVTVPEALRDRDLPGKLRAEGSGILNRMLDGLRDWLDSGLVAPEAVTDATKEYREDSDPLGRFLAACVRAAPGKRVQATPMYELFQAWARRNGEPQWKDTGFGHAMREHGYRSKKSGVNFWLDVELIMSAIDFDGGDERGAGEEADEIPV